MTIDAREMEDRELFLKLKEIFARNCINEVSIEVLINTQLRAKRAKAFVTMSGFRTVTEEKEGDYLVKISGFSCRCSS